MSNETGKNSINFNNKRLPFRKPSLPLLLILIITLLSVCSCDNDSSNSENNSNNINNANNINNTNNGNNINNINNSNNTQNPSCTDLLMIIEQEIRDQLDSIVTDTDFTLEIESAHGAKFSHSIGSATPSTSYPSASTSKWVTASVIMDLVNDGTLSLDDSPDQYIDFWPTTGNLSEIKLKHLLSFTSGLTEEALCTSLGGFDFENCINNILTKNPDSTPPGEVFHYGPNHLQVAGLMAINATQSSNWNELFDAFKLKTGLFENGVYDLPSNTNPRLAGGMHWQTDEYFAFVKALFENSILTAQSISLMESDQLFDATIGYSPSVVSLGEDWHYGFGNWIECHQETYNCQTITRVSSAGAYGAYPFIDYEYNYFGVLGREGALNTFDKGYEVFTTIEPKLREWATMECK
jgi:Beta-lactamase